MIRAKFDGGSNVIAVSGLWQWDWGQTLAITGLCLPPAIEIHFDNGSTKLRVIGETISGVTFAAIPNVFLETADPINVYVYVVDSEQGKTLRQIVLNVQERDKPEGYEPPDTEEVMGRILEQINTYVAEAEAARDSAASEADRAEMAAKMAADAVQEVSGEVEDAKADIDAYVKEKEAELKGDVGNVYFASFKVVEGRLKMYSDPAATKIAFRREGSRLKYKVQIGG